MLGEAAGQLSAEVKDKFPDMRLAAADPAPEPDSPGLWSIDLEVLHTTAAEQLPAFTANLRTVLSSVTGNA